MGPLVRVGQHSVDVAQIAQRRAVSRLAAQPGHEVGTVGLGAEQLALEPRPRQVVGQVFLGRALVARGVDGVEGDQLRQQLLCLCGEIGAHPWIVRPSPARAPGTDASSSRVYGWVGALKICSPGPSSTIFPSSITAIRSHM